LRDDLHFPSAVFSPCAPGGSLRRHLTALGYSFDLLRQSGLLNANGSDAFYQRIVFPLRQREQIVNLYGRGVAWINCFLDREYVRRFADTSAFVGRGAIPSA
jgi:hypothetical protein